MSKQRSDNDQSDVFNLFNLNDFKKWINTQQNENSSKPHMVGLQVESKVNLKKLISKMDAQEGEEEDLAKDFKHNGGIISETDGQNILIEVDSGSFIIHKMYIKKAAD